MSKKWVIVFTMAAMAAMLVGAGSGFAATRTWDGDTSVVWSNALNWAGDIAPGIGDVAAIVGGVANQPTIGAVTQVDGVTFDSSGGAIVLTVTATLTITADGNISATGGNGVTIGGANNITALGALNIDNDDSGGLNLNVAINGDGTNAITFSGAENISVGSVIGGGATPVTIAMDALLDVVTFSGDNSYTGITTVNAGNLTLTAAGHIANTSAVTMGGAASNFATGGVETIGSLSGGPGTVFMGGAMTINQTEDTIYSGIISGSGVLWKDGTGTLALNGNDSYIGATEVFHGTLLVNGPAGAVDGAYTVWTGATLGGVGTLTNATNVIIVSPGGTMRPGNGSTGGTFTTSGAFTLSDATSLFIVDISGTDCGNLVVTPGIAFTNSGTVELGTVANPVAANNYTIVTRDAPVDDFTGNNTSWVLDYGTAGFIILVGEEASNFVWIGTNSTLWNGNNWDSDVDGNLDGAIDVGQKPVNDATVIFNVNSTTNRATVNDIALTGITIQMAAANQGGAISINAIFSIGIINISQSSTAQDLTISGTVALNADAPISIVAGRKVTITAGMTGAFGIDKSGAGTLELNGANAFSGTLTITSGPVTTNGAGKIDDTADVTLVDDATAILTLGGPEKINTLTGGARSTIDVGAFTLTVDQDGAATMAGVITGSGGLTIDADSANTLSLSGDNTYTGTTTINKGLTTIGAERIADTSDVTMAATGVFTIGGAEKINTLTGVGATCSIVLGVNTLTVDQDGAATFAGVISGDGGLTIDLGSTAALTLSGINTYSGATTVNASTLNFNGANIGVSAVAVNNAAKLAGTGTIPGSVTMNNTSILAPGGTNGDAVGILTINGILTFNDTSKYVLTMTGGSIDKIIAGSNLVAAAANSMEFQAGASSAGLAIPAIVMTIGGTYTTALTNNLGAGYVVDSAKDGGNNIKLTAIPAAVIPTLTEWGLILFALLIATFAIWGMRRKNYKAA